VTNPHTGKEKNKHKLGGSYPGNRRKPQQQYAPPASDFHNGQAVAHFISYGGGNALVLQQNGNQPQKGEKAKYVQGKQLATASFVLLVDYSSIFFVSVW
jgi:hypothetical protein